MAGKTTPSTSKTKPEGSISGSKIPRTYRKSPSRMDASGDAKPASKSPSRATGAKKTPTKPKSPSRKSPSRKSPAREKPPGSPNNSIVRGRPRKNLEEIPVAKTPKSSKASSTPTSKSKPVPDVTIDSDSDSDYALGLSSEKPKARVQGRTRRSVDVASKLIEVPQSAMAGSMSKVNREEIAMRRSARLFTTNTERPIHIKTYYEPIVKLTEFSDDDDLVHRSNKGHTYLAVTNKPSKGAVFGNVVFAILFPAVMIVLNAVCAEKVCNFQLPPFTPFFKLSTYYHPMTLMVSLGFILAVTVLTVLPFGGRVVKGLQSNARKPLTYCMNGLFVTTIMMVLTAIAQWCDIPILPFIRQHWMQFNASFLVLCPLIAIILYMKGRYVPLAQQNPQAMTTSVVINFLEGKEVNPRLFGVVDVKYVMYRTALIAFIILNVLFAYTSLSYQSTPVTISTNAVPIWPLSLLTPHINIQPTILTLTTMQLIYFLDMFIFERSFLSSFEIQYSGTGLLKCFELMGGIFTYTLLGRFVLDNNIQLDWWKLVLSVSAFLVGYLMYRASNLQKHSFRVNPYNPKISHYESIPTSTGSKLLVSGLWGFVRHPNYLGDILIHLSFLPFVCCSSLSILLYIIIFGLVARAYSDNERCKKKYGQSWDRYCQKVKYILVPKVY